MGEAPKERRKIGGICGVSDGDNSGDRSMLHA